MFQYFLIEYLRENYDFSLYTHGLKCDVGGIAVKSAKECEEVTRSILNLDEFFNLIDLEDRKKRKDIEKTIRLIHHNNNVLILAGTPDNFKKFISSKLDVMIFGSCSVSDFINGSKIKKVCTDYCGDELGSEMLNIPIGKMLIYDGHHYNMIEFPYLEKYDTKKANLPILNKKEVKNE
jgi:hypothetical protein